MTEAEVEAELAQVRLQISDLQQFREKGVTDRRRLAIFILGLAAVFALTGFLLAWLNNPVYGTLILISLCLTAVGAQLHPGPSIPRT